MEKKIMRKKTLIGVGLFVVIFSALLALASIYDLQVSQKLATSHLSGLYYANPDFMFGLTLEAFGSFPAWLAIAVFGAIIYANAMNSSLFLAKEGKDKNLTVLNTISAVVGLIAVVGALYFLFSDCFKYFLKYALNYEVKHYTAYFGTSLLLSIVMSPFFVRYFTSMSEEKITALKTIAWIILVAFVTRIFIEGIKAPIGRMRFRAMDCLGDFSYYTPWYVINGSRSLLDITINPALLEEYFTATNSTMANFSMESYLTYCHIPIWEFKDACRSFPSGHTFAAGMTYVFICLPDINKKYDNVVGRFLCWLLPTVFTGLVAISRIMVGAHYFSDVLFGGTIVYLGVIIGREIFIFKGAHIKCFMKDKPTKA